MEDFLIMGFQLITYRVTALRGGELAALTHPRG